MLFTLVAVTLLEAGPRERLRAETRVQVVGEVRLPQAIRFALIRDPSTGHLSLYKDGEAIFEGQNPLPLGSIVAVNDNSLLFAGPTGLKVEVAKGGKLPGPREMIFVGSAMIDTLRYQVRSGETGTSGSDYAVFEIAGRRAILERRVASVGSGPGFPGEEVPVAELVNRVPFVRVAPDTWEVPARAVKQMGGQVGPLLAEALSSATPSLTAGYGIALHMDTSLGTGTLDRRGFLIQYSKLAHRAGLEVGDRILFVNGQPVSSFGGLVRMYRALKSDSSLSDVKVVINRKNQMRTLTYRLR